MQLQIINDVRQRAQQLLEENATTLLTAGGVVGTVATAVLAWRGGRKYENVLLDRLDEHNAGLDLEDEEQYAQYMTVSNIPVMTRIQWMAPHAVPPVISGASTIGAIIFSHKMNAQKAAALAAAYGLTQKQFEEYKEKAAEKLGVTKKQKVDDELAQDRVNKTPGASQIVVVEGEVLCFDQPTGRYFRSTMEGINRAVNSVNTEILRHENASASRFYEELGLPATTWTDEVGWNSSELVELTISTVLSPDDRPCIAIDFANLPKLNYDRRMWD